MPSSSSISAASGPCPYCHGLGYVRVDVPVGHPDFGKLQPCTCRMVEQVEQRIARLRVLSNLDTLADRTFETFVPDGHGLPEHKQENLRRAYEAALEYAEAPTGWLLFKGGYGCGKTHLAAAIANRAVERGRPVLFITVPDLLDHLRATFNPANPAAYDDRFEEVRTIALLILDDLGTESPTPWAQEKLFQLLNYRYNARLPTVITTNHELEDIPLRLRSRLNDPDVGRIIAILAPDFRGSGTLADQSDLSSLYLHVDQTFETFDLRGRELPPEEAANLREAMELSLTYARLPEGWLAFLGTYGCGKTHLAAAIANDRFRKGLPVLFVVVPDLLDHLRATFNPQSTVTFDKRFEEIRRAPFLVLDDLGTESATPWAREKLYQVFDYRYNARLPTVITTSATLESLEPRLATRMLDVSRCTAFFIRAPAYRASRPQHKTKRR
ncbi:MAG: ATP-binding protein [Anaerolineae bacterium]|nr:ATP-binding protein [Anaerolineae bacterium]